MNLSEGASPTLLVVDDDEGIRQLLSRYLQEQGYACAAVADGRAMDAWLSRNQASLIILDLMLPGEDGLSLARRIRAQSTVPIIMLTAKGEDIDRIIGLEMGADDYLPKPFNPRELLARIKSVLRRSEPTTVPTAANPPETVRFGDFVLDLDRGELLQEGRAVALTSGELDLLLFLARHPGRIWDRDQLLDQLSGRERDPFDRSIDVRITRLRRKIEADPHAPRFIQTVWGKGYRFMPEGTS